MRKHLKHVPRPWRRGSRAWTATVAAVGCVAVTSGIAVAGVDTGGGFGSYQVGQVTAHGTLLPSNQWIRPIGTRTLVTNGRLPSSTLSPDGRTVAALTWETFTGFLSIINVQTGKVIQQVGTGAPGDPTLGDGSVAADGPFYSPDGKSLWVPQSVDLLRFAVNPDGTVNPAPVATIQMPSAPGGAALPSGMAFSPDGSTAYVALNGANTLGVINTATNTLVSQIPVGNAPRQVVIVGNQAFVSNEGGRPARSGDFTNLSDGTPIVADKTTGAATTGTVSVVDLAAGRQTASIPVGLEPTALYLHDGTLMVANSNDDSVSLIDTSTLKVTQTFGVNPLPGATVGSYPNAITMPDASHILVSIGRDNAIGVYRYSGPAAPVRFEGLLPTDWYPVNVTADPQLGKLIVTNDKGIGARGPASTINEGPGTSPATGHNSYDDTGSLTAFTMPPDAALPRYTHQVFANNNWLGIPATPAPGPAATGAPAPVPALLGGPSPIKHVFLIVKENRTYDQVLGDVAKGNGDPALAQFGAQVTPNQHALAGTFGLYDNFYDVGTLSADGHNWLTQADANDYIEREFGAFWRSYPASGGDALAYQRDGFLWNAAQRAGLTAASFGEYNNFITLPSNSPTWSQWYQDSRILEHKAPGPLPVPIHKYYTYSDIPSLNAIDDKWFPLFDLDIPDQYRVDIWNQAFQQSVKTGTLPSLNLMWVMCDHTAGIGGGDPYPVAEVADNDLAVGRIVDAISHSKFWKSSAIFVVEDDPQNGVDHVDGHRSTLQVISPYAKRGVVNSTYYTQVNVVRTIEQILGIHPMNQMDLAARPMFNAFTSQPDFTPYTALPSNVPLTYGVSGVTFGTVRQARMQQARMAHGSFTGKPVVPLPEKAVYLQWVAWSARQHFGGSRPAPDQANPAQLNRLDWYTAHNWTAPYPGDSKILAPDQVPGRALPAGYLGG